MSLMVDSKKQLLNPVEIVTIALENIGSEYPMNVAIPAILTEFSQPNSNVKQIGNTLFSVLLGDDRKSFFKAFNADTAQNFIENGKEFTVYAYNDLQQDYLVTEFEDPAISKIFQVSFKDPPMPNMGFQEFAMRSGKSRIVIKLGQERT